MGKTIKNFKRSFAISQELGMFIQQFADEQNRSFNDSVNILLNEGKKAIEQKSDPKPSPLAPAPERERY